MWQSHAFDVLVAYNHSRFGRSSTLHSWVIENTILAGAKIYLIQGGWIDADAFRFQIAMGGVTATADIDRLVKARDIAMDAKAKRGLPTTSIVPMSHRLIRDETGKAVKIVLDEQHEQLWQDLATLILEGVSWSRIEVELFNRFGYGNSRGQPYQRCKFYGLINTPTFWGHSARHHRGINGEARYRAGTWLYEPGHPVPDGVLIYYDTHEPAYSGEQAVLIKAEIARRRQVISGRARPGTTYKFSGLIICARCGYRMVKHSSK